MTQAAALEGLSSQAASERLKLEGFNELPAPNRRDGFRIALEVLRQPMFALLIGAGVIYLLLGDRIEAILLLVFASLSVAITIIQESRSEHVLETLRSLSSPRALVIRDGQRVHVAGKELVREDVIIVSEGDRVSADATLISSLDLLLDESLLTGESIPVGKSPQPLAAASNNSPSIFAGTLVVRGTGIATVHATGVHTEMGKIGRALNTIDTEQAHLQKQMRPFVRNFAIVGAVAGAVTVVLFGLFRGSWLEALLSGIAIGMSLLPEEFPLVMAVFMAMGAWRISQVQVLTRRASAIETLGATTVLCTDKTGTLTENRMSLVSLVGDGVRWDQQPDAPMAPAIADILQAALLACPAEPSDPMDLAIQRLAEHQLGSKTAIFEGLSLIKAYGLRAEFFAVANLQAKAGETTATAYAKGAAEAIGQLCQWSDAQRARIHEQADSLASKGIRVLCVAKAPNLPLDKMPDTLETLSSLPFEFVGLLGFTDPLRASVPAAIAECHSAGIRVVMITGDYPVTAKAIGLQAGLEADQVLTGDELEALSDDELAKRVKTTVIYARIRPTQKLRIVQSLKANGEVVAMTGDGVNDAPAIKAANIGIAMGGRGTDVAREASAIVLLNDDFGSIVHTIRLGRRIHDNLRKAIEFIVAVHIPIAGLAILPLALGLPLIMTPIHIAFLEMIIDPACSIVLEAEAEEDNVMQRPPRDPKSPLLLPRRIVWAALQGLLVLALLATILIGASRLTLPEPDLRALVFTALVLMNMGLILVNRSFSASMVRAFLRPNRSLWIMFGAVLALLTVAVYWPPAQSLFHFGRLHWDDLGTVLAASLFSVLALETLKSLWFRAAAPSFKVNAGSAQVDSWLCSSNTLSRIQPEQIALTTVDPCWFATHDRHGVFQHSECQRAEKQHAAYSDIN